jgi:hypothetical protein
MAENNVLLNCEPREYYSTIILATPSAHNLSVHTGEPAGEDLEYRSD